MKKVRILYAGDSPAGGSANYLLAILRSLKVDWIHLPPDEILSPARLKKSYGAIILSDFSKNHVPDSAQKLICQRVLDGAGLLMVGGWGSFSGPYGGWHGTKIEEILPVACLSADDRIAFPGGAYVMMKNPHAMFRGISFHSAPMICGLNHVRPKRKGLVLLTARKILRKGNPTSRKFQLILQEKEYPLLVLDSDSRSRIAALTTDLAPHWCGGFVDWGKARSLLVTDKIEIEVGHLYVRFVSSLIRWLARITPTQI
jgi:uncharacterized membrane protein